jgi:hypothetical protein
MPVIRRKRFRIQEHTFLGFLRFFLLTFFLITKAAGTSNAPRPSRGAMMATLA